MAPKKAVIAKPTATRDGVKVNGKRSSVVVPEEPPQVVEVAAEAPKAEARAPDRSPPELSHTAPTSELTDTPAPLSLPIDDANEAGRGGEAVPTPEPSRRHADPTTDAASHSDDFSNTQPETAAKEGSVDVEVSPTAAPVSDDAVQRPRLNSGSVDSNGSPAVDSARQGDSGLPLPSARTDEGLATQRSTTVISPMQDPMGPFAVGGSAAYPRADEAIAQLSKLTLTGVEAMLHPMNAALADTAGAQATLRERLADATRRQHRINETIASVELTFSKIPRYIEKLGLIRKNLEILEQNAKKLRRQACDVKTEVDQVLAPKLHPVQRRH